MAHTMSSKRLKKVPEAPKQAFDLATRFRHDSIVVSIPDPVDGTDTGMRVRLKSMQSEEAQKAREQFRSTLTIVDDKVQVSETDAEASLRAQVIACTVEWWAEPDSPDGLVINGVVVPCTPEAVTEMYTDPKTSWFYGPVLTKYLDLAAFFGASKAA